jgi:hypothetical protein
MGPHGWRRAPRDPVTHAQSLLSSRSPSTRESRRAAASSATPTAEPLPPLIRPSDGGRAPFQNLSARRTGKPVFPHRLPSRPSAWRSNGRGALRARLANPVCRSSRVRARTDGPPHPSITVMMPVQIHLFSFFAQPLVLCLSFQADTQGGREGASDWLALNYIRIV